MTHGSAAVVWRCRPEAVSAGSALDGGVSAGANWATRTSERLWQSAPAMIRAVGAGLTEAVVCP